MDEETGLFIYGTPLAEVDDEPAPSKKLAKRVDQEIVTDEKGRRRFHGAFTGGFSAGHFNTVATPEGWEPSTFVSSRSSGRSNGGQQRPEDFMDDEDMEAAGIRPKGLRPTEKFATETTCVAPSSSLPPDKLKILLKPIRQTIGSQILKKWGWRPGRGVGPKVELPTSSIGEGSRVYGCAPGPSTSRDAVVHVSPEDEVGFEWEPKNDLFGLGYKSVLRKEAVRDRKVDAFRLSSGGRGIRGQAFGIGVFEEPDEDIYSVDNLEGLDFVTGPEESKDAGQESSFSKEFVRASETEVRPYFPSPRVPRDYKPRFVAAVSTAPPPPAVIASGNFDLKPLGTLRKAREQVKVEVQEKWDTHPADVPGTSPQFNGAKQERYEWYQRSQRLGIAPKCPRDVTQEQWDVEMAEFASLAKSMSAKEQRANEASVATKLAMQMMSRFTTGGEETVLVEKSEQKTTEETDKLKAVEMKMFGQLTRSSFDWYPDRVLCRRMNVPEPYPGSTFTGIPGLKKPPAFKSMLDEVTSTPSIILRANARLAKTRWDSSPSTSRDENSAGDPEATEATRTDSEPATTHSDTPKQEAEIERPPLDFFRSIFTISDDEDEDTGEEVDETPISVDSALVKEEDSRVKFQQTESEQSETLNLLTFVKAEDCPRGPPSPDSRLFGTEASEKNSPFRSKTRSPDSPARKSVDPDIAKDGADSDGEQRAEILAASYGPAVPPDLPDNDDEIEVIGSVHRSSSRKSKSKHKKKRHRSSRSPHSRRQRHR